MVLGSTQSTPREPEGSQIRFTSMAFQVLAMRFQVYSTLPTVLGKISRRNPKVSSSVWSILALGSILIPPGPPWVSIWFQAIMGWLQRKTLVTEASVELVSAEISREIGSVARP